MTCAHRKSLDWVAFLEDLERLVEQRNDVDNAARFIELRKRIQEQRSQLSQSVFAGDLGAGRGDPSETARATLVAEADKYGDPIFLQDNASSIHTWGTHSTQSAQNTSFLDVLKLAAIDINTDSHSRRESTVSPDTPNTVLTSEKSGVTASEASVASGAAEPVIVNEARLGNAAMSFPVYRKLYVHQTVARSMMSISSKKRKESGNFASAFSANCRYFALTSQISYYIYKIPLQLCKRPELLFKGSVPKSCNETFVAMSNDWCVICSDTGQMIVVSNISGNIIFTRDFEAPIFAVAASPNGQFICCSSLFFEENFQPGGQPILHLLCPNTFQHNQDAFDHVDAIFFASPYSDPVHVLSFSKREVFLACATKKESRFYIVLLSNPRKPRVLLRSSRQIPLDGDYEGVTSVTFFEKRNYLLVTSVAQNSPPIVVDCKFHVNIESNSVTVVPSNRTPSVFSRLSEFDPSIHAAAIGCQDTALALLDKSGAVYVMETPRLGSSQQLRAICFEVAKAEKHTKAAALKFSPDGTILFAVDRRGVFFAADFGAGTPHGEGMGKGKIFLS